MLLSDLADQTGRLVEPGGSPVGHPADREQFRDAGQPPVRTAQPPTSFGIDRRAEARLVPRGDGEVHQPHPRLGIVAASRAHAV